MASNPIDAQLIPRLLTPIMESSQGSIRPIRLAHAATTSIERLQETFIQFWSQHGYSASSG